MKALARYLSTARLYANLLLRDHDIRILAFGIVIGAILATTASIVVQMHSINAQLERIHTTR